MVSFPFHSIWNTTLSIVFPGGPSPATYFLSNSLLSDNRATTLAYKWFDPEGSVTIV